MLESKRPEAKQSCTSLDTHDPLAPLYPQIQHLSVAVEHILRGLDRPVTELELIKTLQGPPWTLIGEVRYSEPDQLYPVHFLLFHVLYSLRDQLANEGIQVDISPLGIHLSQQTVVSGSGPAGHVDELRKFYLDLSNVQLSEETISQMMDDFWAGRSGRHPGESDAQDAAKTLGFPEIPARFTDVKQTFRRAVMRAHPDRGGKTEAIQDLNRAFSVLKAYFNNPLKRQSP